MAHTWGATLCFGFVYFRAIAPTRKVSSMRSVSSCTSLPVHKLLFFNTHTHTQRIHPLFSSSCLSSFPLNSLSLPSSLQVVSLALQLLPHLEADDQLLVNAALFLLAEGPEQRMFPVPQDAWSSILARAGMHAGDPAVEQTLHFTASSERGRCGAGRPLCYVRSSTTALVDIAYGDVPTHTRHTVRVALLAHALFPRRCRRGFDGKRAAGQGTGPYVAHCYTPKTQAGKLGGFDRYNLWFID